MEKTEFFAFNRPKEENAKVNILIVLDREKARRRLLIHGDGPRKMIFSDVKQTYCWNIIDLEVTGDMSPSMIDHDRSLSMNEGIVIALRGHSLSGASV